jgi:aspartate oxidase
MNNAGVCEMNDRLGMHMDDPSVVARAIVNALVNDRAETYIGLAERAYRIVNAVFPAVIDKAMRRQLPIVREYASKRQVASTPTNEPVQAIHR